MAWIKHPWLRNRYVWSGLAFAVYMLFFDSNHLLSLYDLKSRQESLKKDERWYKGKIEEIQRKLKELNSNEDQLEKFARESYQMKRDDEDVFVLVDRSALE